MPAHTARHLCNYYTRYNYTSKKDYQLWIITTACYTDLLANVKGHYSCISQDKVDVNAPWGTVWIENEYLLETFSGSSFY